MSRYTILTVGDGLVTQIPALIVSTAAGIIVTHAVERRTHGCHAGEPDRRAAAVDVHRGIGAVQLRTRSGTAQASLPAAGRRVDCARESRDDGRYEARRRGPRRRRRRPTRAAGADPVTDLLQLDPIELEVGYALIPLVDDKQGGDLLERITLLRKQAAQELGILVPPIRIRDDIRLPANEYVIKLRGSEIARGEVMPRFLMALDTGRVINPIDGIDTIDPSFGMPARWIAISRRGDAESMGYVVVEPTTVVATHLMEKLKSNAADLLGRQDVQEMVDRLKKTHPALVDDVIPSKVTLGVLHRVLQRLLKERIPIRDMVTILEAVADASDQTKDPEVLTEHARRALTNVIARLFMDDAGLVRGITLGPRLESALVGLFSPRANQSPANMLTPDSLGALLRQLDAIATANTVEGRSAPLLAPPSLRVGIRRLVEPVLPNLPVVSMAELPPYVKLSSVAQWETANAA